MKKGWALMEAKHGEHTTRYYRWKWQAQLMRLWFELNEVGFDKAYYSIYSFKE